LFALAVALGHSGGLWGRVLFPGKYAVQGFFIISGFLITLILHEKYTDNWLFWSNRALRIYVPYLLVWAVSLAALWPLAMLGVRPSYADSFLAVLKDFPSLASTFALVTNLGIFGQDLGLWMRLDDGVLSFDDRAIVSGALAHHVQVLAPAWTIAIELTFYALAPFLVRRSILTIVTLISVSLVARFLMHRAGFNYDPWLYRFFPFELALFLMGALAYRIYAATRHRPIWQPRNCWIVTAVVVGGILWLDQQAVLYKHPWRFFFLFAAATPFLFIASTRSKLDRALGDLSYPIYLIHWPVLLTVLVVASGPTVPLVVIPVTLLLSILFVQGVERPLDRFRQSRARTPQPSTPAATPPTTLHVRDSNTNSGSGLYGS
jgi:peptidoglycan/LPS O-acetylase OafA/YrhL